MKAKIYSQSQHNIDIDLIDKDALYIIERLQEAGFVAYLVGGGVRDLLIQKKPKDFDISTSATPEELKSLFRNCLLIGRRFRLAHLRFGKKVIEVSTFRSGDNDDDKLIIRDNEWGSPQEDVLRRDFTINGLFFDPKKQEVIDYVQGYEDLEKNLLRTIGKAKERFLQDPVRIMRMLKFRARFGFQVEKETDEAAHLMHEHILHSAPARILEETFKMLESGASEKFFRLMQEYGLLEKLYAPLSSFVNSQHGEDLYSYLRAADEYYHVRESRPLARPVLMTCLMFPLLAREINKQALENPQKNFTLGEIIQLSHSVVRSFIHNCFPPIPKRLKASVNFIIDSQFRLTPVTHKKIQCERYFTHEDFWHALKFLKVRSILDHHLDQFYQNWRQSYEEFRKKGGRPFKRMKRKNYGKRSRQDQTNSSS